MHRIVKTILKRNTIYRRSVLIYQYKIYYNHHDKISENRKINEWNMKPHSHHPHKYMFN